MLRGQGTFHSGKSEKKARLCGKGLADEKMRAPGGGEKEKRGEESFPSQGKKKATNPLRNVK